MIHFLLGVQMGFVASWFIARGTKLSDWWLVWVCWGLLVAVIFGG